MRKKKVILTELFLLTIFMLFTLTSCSAIEEYKMTGIDRQYQKTKKEDEWWQRNIKDVLYVGMPENEFVTRFTKKESIGDVDSPYIIDKRGTKYIVVGLNGKEKYRITFVDGLLSKYEQFGLGQNPFGYSDSTFLLHGYKADGPGFYNAMPEGELLQAFSGSIISQAGNRYTVIGKNGRKYRITFTNGFLSGMESLR